MKTPVPIEVAVARATRAPGDEYDFTPRIERRRGRLHKALVLLVVVAFVAMCLYYLVTERL